MNFFHGSTATAVITPEATGNQTYAADGANNVVNPPTTITKTVTISNLSIAAGSTYYLAWAYIGNNGSTNSQGIGLDNFSITATSTPSTSPSLSTSTNTLSGFTYVQGTGPSASQSFTVSGSNLSPAAENITVAGSTNYEVSADNTTFGATATIAYTGGSLTNVPVYVRLKAGLPAGTYSGETITISGGGAGTSPTVTVNGSVTAPEINLAQGSTNIATGGSYSFGSIIQGNSSSVITFTIQNTGSAALSLSGSPIVSISGANAADFTLTQPSTSSVAAGGSTIFTVKFTPSTAGAESAQLSIANNDADENPYVITLNGTGVAAIPEIDITGNSVSIPSGSTTTSTANHTDFGSAVVSVSTVVRTFTIKNTGTGTLSLTGTSPYITISGANASDFTVTATPANSVAPSGSTTFKVTFNPTASGTRTATVSVANNDADENPYTFAIQGAATDPAPEINLAQGSTNIATGGTYTFASSIVSGNSSTAITFTIQNTGTAALSLAGTPKIAISGTNASEFVINQTATTASVAPSGTTIFTVTFSPSTAGTKTAQISIANNDADENPYLINLSGTATASAASTITADAAYTYNSDAVIDYTNYQESNIPANGSGSIDVFQFIIRDGGSTTDADNLPTILSGITFSSVQNIASIQDAALYDGSTQITNVVTINTTSNTLAFSGLSGTHVTAPDGGTKTLTLRVSFKTTVTEQQLQFSITSANVTAPSGTSSAFASFTTVQSSVTPATRNKVSVTATTLAYQQQPSDVAAGAAMTPAVTVAAVDINGNLDVDFTSAVTLNLTATAACNTLSGNTVNATAGVATFSSLRLSTAEPGVTLVASSSGLTSVTSSTFNITGSGSAVTTLVAWNFEDQNATRDAGNANNTANTVTTTSTGNSGVPGYSEGSGGANTYAISNSGWSNGYNTTTGVGTKYWLINVDATGYQSLTVSSKQGSSGTGPRNFKIQYQLNSTAGTWIDVATVPEMTLGTVTGNNFSQGIVSSAPLPAACNNQASVYIRWVLSSNTSADGGTIGASGTSRIDDIVIAGESITTASGLYYRSYQTGNFGAACNWETSTDGINNWIPAAAPPDLSSKTVTIRSPHIITINSARTIDEVVVDNGGTLVLNNYALTINNGEGTDFIVNGTFQDNASSVNNVTFNTDAKWLLGANGTFIKSNTSSAAVYRDNYEGTMSSIPATANWIIRYTGSGNTNFTTNNGTFYPNLTFESTSGVWDPGIQTSRFNGSTGFATIKGNLDIGGSGTGTVVVYNQNTNESPLLIQGNLIIRSGNTLTNNGTSAGTGFELKGNLTVNGTLTANGTGMAGVFNFTGVTQQTISGAGTVTLNDVTINNSSSGTGINNGVLLNRDLTIGGALTLTLGPLVINGKTLSLSGAVSHSSTLPSGSLTGSATSNVELNGPAAKALYFTNPGNVLHNLTIDATASNAALDNALDITSGTETTTYGTVICNGALQTNGYLTLKSDQNGTAAVGRSAGTISGNVTVERYTNANPNEGFSRRAWRLLTAPVTGVTIRDAWQEGGDNNTSYGTKITGEKLTPQEASDAGFDYIGGGNHTSIKQYQPGPTGGAWVPLTDQETTGTNRPIYGDQPAYMLFVRGDRSVGASGSSIATLRAKGTLVQGPQTVAIQTGSLYSLVGNPYASTIDFGSVLSNNTAIQDKFYLWDSKAGRYGAYVLVDHLGNGGTTYEATPAPFDQNPALEVDAYRYIPSGAGFFVTPAPNASSTTLEIREDDKVTSANEQSPLNPFRVVTATNVREVQVNLNLMDSDTSLVLADGFRARFSDDYAGNEDDNSSVKAANLYENLGLVHRQADGSEQNFIIEARSEVRNTDTLFLKMWNVSKQSYRLQIKGDNFASAPGIQAWLTDSYLGTKQEVDLSGRITNADFSITSDSLSWKSNRFAIVFQNNSAVLPVTLTNLKASAENGGVNISWTASNEVNIKQYVIEKSADGGFTYTAFGAQAARNNPGAALAHYTGFDASPKAGDNLYRIRIEAGDGSTSYSGVVKVSLGTEGGRASIAIYPNPVRDGKVNLMLTNLPAGSYVANLYSNSGQVVYQRRISVSQSGAVQNEELKIGKGLAQGSYRLRVTDSKGTAVKETTLIAGR